MSLRGPGGLVVLFREGRLAKLREKLVEAIERNRCGAISTPNGRPDAA
jgi:hypothetical protein